MLSFATVRELYELYETNNLIEIDQMEYVQLEGWIRTNRFNGSVGFIELNDGSFLKNCQIVYTDQLDNYLEVKKWLTGTAISITGKFVITKNHRQSFEIQTTEINLIGVSSADYPLQKKRHSFEYLRNLPYLRARTNTFSAIFRIRSALTMAVHEFFQNQGFVCVNTTIINDNVALDESAIFKIAVNSDDNENNIYDVSASNQFQAEAFSLAFRDVYVFKPVLQVKDFNINPNEIWVVQSEIAFADLLDNMDLLEDLIKSCVEYIFDNCEQELNFFNKYIDNTLITRLKVIMEKPFYKITYTKAIEYLQNSNNKLIQDIKWGNDFSIEQKQYLCKELFAGPVFVTDYPKELKDFYLRINDDDKTVASFDLFLFELDGLCMGSQREERLDVLQNRMVKLNISQESLQWYLDLRRYGSCEHAGFGLIFDKLVMLMTGMKNVQDVIPFAKTFSSKEY